MQVPNYLQRSKVTGVYGFRIAVPQALRAAIGKREIKKSLKTRDLHEARVRGLAEFERAQRLFTTAKLTSQEDALNPLERFATVRRWAEAEGFDPSTHPDPHVNEDEYLARDDAADRIIDKARAGKATALEKMKLSALLGTLKPPEPAVTDMVTLYLAERNTAQQRGEADSKAFALMTKRYEGYLLAALGKDKKIVSVSRADARGVRDWIAKRRVNGGTMKPSSVNKALRMIRAMFNHAIREWELNTTNPFAGLKVEETEIARDARRPFTDEELGRYLSAASGMNRQAENCTLLMAFTGARTAEVTGLERQDIFLDGEIPYVSIRPNTVRGKLKTDASRRNLPLVGPALKAACDALAETEGQAETAPLFPRYGRPRGEDALSRLQSKMIRDKLGIADKALTGYSTRHTLKDRLRNALVMPDLQDAIMGHSSGQIGDNYGTGYWLPRLQEALLKAHGLSMASVQASVGDQKITAKI